MVPSGEEDSGDGRAADNKDTTGTQIAGTEPEGPAEALPESPATDTVEEHPGAPRAGPEGGSSAAAEDGGSAAVGAHQHESASDAAGDKPANEVARMRSELKQLRYELATLKAPPQQGRSASHSALCSKHPCRQCARLSFG